LQQTSAWVGKNRNAQKRKTGMADLQIEYRELDSLIPYAKNARTHTEEQVLKIASRLGVSFNPMAVRVQCDCHLFFTH
jgi:hypothetical protein